MAANTDQPSYAHQPGHPDYDQYMSLRSMVDKMHGENGIDMHSGDISHRATSALLRAYKTEAMRDHASIDPRSDVDGVALSRANERYPDVGGKYAILYQGDPNNPTVRTLAVPSHELTRPAEQNLQEINRLNEQRQQQLVQTQERQQAQQQTHGPDQPGMGGRSNFP